MAFRAESRTIDIRGAPPPRQHNKKRPQGRKRSDSDKMRPQGRTMERQRQKPPPKKIGQEHTYNILQWLGCCCPPHGGGYRGGQGGTATKKEKLTFRLLRVCKGTDVNRKGDSPPRQRARDRREHINARYLYGNGASLAKHREGLPTAFVCVARGNKCCHPVVSWLSVGCQLVVLLLYRVVTKQKRPNATNL